MSRNNVSASVHETAKAISSAMLTSDQLWRYGYPHETEPNSGLAVLYIDSPVRVRPFRPWNVDAPEFVPGGKGKMEDDFQQLTCARCKSSYYISKYNGEYLTQQRCLYHWGRAAVDGRHSCCSELIGAPGCSAAPAHVCSGTQPGLNGPLEGFVRTYTCRGGVYAVDTEMCFTAAGLELASVAVVAADGRLVYDALVQPATPILDYNTKFSGITPHDIARATKTLKDVQNDLLDIIGSDTILVGHALNNDLRVLKMVHGAVVDTAALYPHARGWPLRRSLRALSAELLGRVVQCGAHSPQEDARAAMDLVLLKVQHERTAALARQTATHF